MDGVAATPERMERYVKTIHSKAVDMAGLVDELSYFTKIYQKVEDFRFRSGKSKLFFCGVHQWNEPGSGNPQYTAFVSM